MAACSADDLRATYSGWPSGQHGGVGCDPDLGPAQIGAGRTGSGRRQLYCHTCKPAAPDKPLARPSSEDLAADQSVGSGHRWVLVRAVEIADAEGWHTSALRQAVEHLRSILAGIVHHNRSG